MNEYVKKKDVLITIHDFIIENRFSHWWVSRALRDLKTRILVLRPSEEVCERVRGKKVIFNKGHKCSVCENVIDYEDNFCRHCGADLRDEQCE